MIYDRFVKAQSSTLSLMPIPQSLFNNYVKTPHLDLCFYEDLAIHTHDISNHTSFLSHEPDLGMLRFQVICTDTIGCMIVKSNVSAYMQMDFEGNMLNKDTHHSHRVSHTCLPPLTVNSLFNVVTI